MEQLDDDVSTEAENVQMMLPSLNSEQMDILRAIVNANDSNNGKCFLCMGVVELGRHIYGR